MVTWNKAVLCYAFPLALPLEPASTWFPGCWCFDAELRTRRNVKRRKSLPMHVVWCANLAEGRLAWSKYTTSTSSTWAILQKAQFPMCVCCVTTWLHCNLTKFHRSKSSFGFHTSLAANFCWHVESHLFATHVEYGITPSEKDWRCKGFSFSLPQTGVM